MEQVFNYIIVFLSGTACGSFFYTLALRYISGEIAENPIKAFLGRSQCPCCKEQIGVLYLVPLLGYFLSKGKCPDCGCRISPLYPLWEVIYGALAIAVFKFFGFGLFPLSIFILCSISICIAIVDFHTFIIPDSLVLLFFIVSLYPVFLQGQWLNNIAGLAFLSVFFLLIMLIFPGAFGGGDLKFFAASGFFFGLEESIVLLEVALITGAVVGSLWGIMKKKGLRVKIPFAPFIAWGIVVTIFLGRHILLWYYTLIY